MLNFYLCRLVMFRDLFWELVVSVLSWGRGEGGEIPAPGAGMTEFGGEMGGGCPRLRGGDFEGDGN